MNREIIIREERPEDYLRVEAIIRKAFWNLYVPGCHEHYLAHILRSHEDFIPELDLVIETDGLVIGSIMYTKNRLTDEDGTEKQILTFGPLCVEPEYQRMGYGKELMEASFQKAVQMGYEAVVIFGSPANYVSSGFKSCKKYKVCLEGDIWPAVMMVKELKPGALGGKKWFYRQSSVYDLDMEEAQRYDDSLEKMEKGFQPSQEEFYILSHASLS